MVAFQGLFAQTTVTGVVQSYGDPSNPMYKLKDPIPLSGAHVRQKGTEKGAFTDSDGRFSLNVTTSPVTLIVSLIGYETYTNKVTVKEGQTVEVYLMPEILELDETVIVSSTRMDEEQVKTAVTLGKTDLQRINTGQDLPVLLNSTPSLFYTSDAGNGIGYSQFRIRGMDLTRINVTVNGIPLNDQESHGVWWVNMPDLASSVNSIQIQRGVGTSTNGGQAFGSSVNIETKKIGLEPSAQISTSMGSFNSYKATAEFSTGLMDNQWGFSGRLSKIYSDGFIDRAYSDLKSYYFAAHRIGKRRSFRFTAFSGKEETYQAWYGVSEADLVNNRTSNVYTYENQTDNYQQDHYQLHYSEKFGEIRANAALHYTLGRGYFEEYETGEALANYGIMPDSGFTPIVDTSDIIRRRWLHNHFVGGTYSLKYDKDLNDKLDLKMTLGGNYNQYFGDHYGELIWSRYAFNSELGDRYYENEAFKRNLNSYLKVGLEHNRFSAQLEAQVRSVHYEFAGISDDLVPINHSVDFLFFNPKAMLTYHLDGKNRIYGYFGRSNREPLRNDFVEVAPTDWPTHESVNDLELGYRTVGSKLSFTANLYYMMFTNQLVQNGQINDVGAYLRVNVPESYRRGIELEATAKLGKGLDWNGNLTLSQNKIANWTAYVEQYDADFLWLGQETEVYEDVDISFSPAILGFSSFNFTPVKGLRFSLQTKYVGKQYLDNTQSDERKIDPFLVNDLLLNYTIAGGKHIKSITLQAMAYNIADELYETSGWTWRYEFDGVQSQDNGYYPQAGRNFMVGLLARF